MKEDRFHTFYDPNNDRTKFSGCEKIASRLYDDRIVNYLKTLYEFFLFLYKRGSLRDFMTVVLNKQSISKGRGKDKSNIKDNVSTYKVEAA